MKLYTGQRWALIGGDCRERLSRFAEHRFDAVVTDPPYELGFMGKAWDSSGVAFQPETWAAVLRVLKPGAHLVAFGGSRTFHRIACAIEDAGFEVRDTLCWLYGTGFPKSLNVAKAIDALERGALVRAKLLHFAETRGIDGKWLEAQGVASASSFKDWTVGGHVPGEKNWQLIKGVLAVSDEEEAAFERVVIGRGTAGLGQGSWVEMGAGFKAEFEITAPATDAARQWEGWGTALKPGWEPIILARKPLDGTVAENVQRWGTGALNVDGCRLDRAAGDVSGWSKTGSPASENRAMSGANYARAPKADAAGRWPPNVCLDEEAAALLDAQTGPIWRAKRDALARLVEGSGGQKTGYQLPDEQSVGGASRFFYCPKASRAERDAGCESLPERSGGQATEREDDSAGLSSPRAGAGRGGGARNHHPTVKPIALMRWLVRLVTPPGGAVLDPFSGSGSTGVAVLEEGFSFCGVEQDAEYLEIARCRLERAARERGAA